MLITLLYHRVGEGKYATPLSSLQTHFEWIASHCRTLFPGECHKGKTPALCLTFDDATYDFYFSIYPLLKEYNLKALLAVPTKYILDKVEAPHTKRWPKEDPFSHDEHFCSFEELREMAQSGLVEIASHSHSHVDLTAIPHEILRRELILSKEILEEKLDVTVRSFAFPYGKLNKRTLKEAKRHYPYIFRIGSAINFDWSAPTYRIVADGLMYKEFPFPLKLQAYWNYALNRVRGR